MKPQRHVDTCGDDGYDAESGRKGELCYTGHVGGRRTHPHATTRRCCAPGDSLCQYPTRSWQGHSKIDRGRETGGMTSEELGPSLLAAVAHVPDMHSPCAPDSGRTVHIRGSNCAPGRALCSRKKRVGRPDAAHPTCSFRVGALSKPQECGYFFFSGSRPWTIEVRPR